MKHEKEQQEKSQSSSGSRPQDALSRRSVLKAGLVACGGTAMLGYSGTAMLGGKALAGNDDLTSLSLSEAADLVRARKVSPVELTQACLDRIARLNPVINAFITVTGESAMREARRAETEIQRGKYRGPLHGIPIAIKDIIDTAGVLTTAASGVYADRVPTVDAELVRRLKDAGAVFLGKQNLHEFAVGASSVVSYFGEVYNPWNVNYVAGGSSGGSAAALAARLCYGAIGSDTAGSIRQPSAFCGLVGLKPTYGRISLSGVIPLAWSIDHVGPMTRSVRDSALMLQAIAGYDPADLASVDTPVPDYESELWNDVSSLRLGKPAGIYYQGLDPDIESAVNAALSVLDGLTAGVQSVDLGEGADFPGNNTLRPENYTFHEKYLNTVPELYQTRTRNSILAGRDIPATVYIRDRRVKDRVTRTIPNTFQDVDLLVTPTSPYVQPTIEAARKGGQPNSLRNTIRFNMYGLPTVSIPCGFTKVGLPIGLMISGPHWAEGRVLQLAYAYEQATDWHLYSPNI